MKPARRAAIVPELSAIVIGETAVTGGLPGCLLFVADGGDAGPVVAQGELPADDGIWPNGEEHFGIHICADDGIWP